MKNYKRFVEAKIPEKPKEYRKPSSFMDALNGVIDGTVNPEEMENFIGLETSKYKITTMYTWSDETSLTNLGVSIILNDTYFAKLINVEDYIPGWIIGILSPYSGYEIDMYGEEEYFGRYLNDEGTKHVKTLAKRYGYELSEDEKSELDVVGLFNYLGLKRLKDDLMSGIQEIRENGIIDTAKKVKNALPFNFDSCYKHNFNLEVEFSWEEVIEYCEKNLKGVKINSLKDFLDNVNTDDMCPDVIEYSMENESEEDWKKLRDDIEFRLEELVDEPEDVIPYIITTDNLDLFKKFMDDANFKISYEGYKYGIWRDDGRRLNLFKLTKKGGKIEEFFKSIEFQRPFMEKYPMEEKDKYFLLKSEEIMHPEIKGEWGWIEESEKFNF